MAELLASGRLVDLIIALVVIEAIALFIYRLVSGRGIALSDLLPNILAGAFLLIALRFALSDGGWMIISLSLAAAGVAHVIDLTRRWQS